MKESKENLSIMQDEADKKTISPKTSGRSVADATTHGRPPQDLPYDQRPEKKYHRDKLSLV